MIRKEHEKDADIKSWEDIPLEVILSYGTLQEDSVQEVSENEGIVEYSYYYEDGSEIEGMGFLSEDFLNKRTDVCLTGMGYWDEQAEIEVVRREADGTLKWMFYIIK